MGDLSGRVAIVTGASRGIGRGAAIALAEAGADIVAAARTVEALEQTVAAIQSVGGRAIAAPCDVARAEDVSATVVRAVDTFGGLDIVINNAQAIDYQLLLESSDETMADALETGPFATFRFMRAAYPHLKRRKGVIVNVGSSAIHMTDTTRYGVYTAAKAGIKALTRAAASEWAADGLRIFLVHPTADSVMTLGWKAREPERYAALVGTMPKGRLGDPLEDVGRPLVRLIHNADRYHGKTIVMTAHGVAETVEVVEDKSFPLP
jgi:NAD(P)-dependent dehydrogenase (short-subunit alcohol dehydrogenase family)